MILTHAQIKAAARPGPKRSPERIELETQPCGTCGAAPGESCSSPARPGRGAGSHLAHADRWHKLAVRELAGTPARSP